MIDRSIKPEGKGNITFSLPEIKRFELSNGMKVLFVEKNSIPVIQLTLLVNGGSLYDPEGKKGLAYLTSLMLDEGAGNYNSLELDNEIESLGTIFGISTDHEGIYLSMMAMMENAERSTELLSMIMREPHFTEEDFERERNKLFAKLLQFRDDPGYIASVNMEKIIFADSPYECPTIGLLEDVKSISTEDVKEYYKTNIAPDTSTMIVVGNLAEEKIKNLLEKYFGTWEKKSTRTPLEIRFEKRKKKCYFINKPEAAQSEIRMGHISSPRKTEDYYAKTIMNTILGGQFTSRINLNLREDKGYTYGASTSFYFNRISGRFSAQASVQSEHTYDAIVEMMKELKGITEGIKTEEAELSKAYLIKRYPSMFETYSQVGKNMAMLSVFDLPHDYFNTYIEKMESTTLDEIEAAGRNNISLDDMNILVVGNKEVVIPQLDSLTGYEIEEIESV